LPSRAPCCIRAHACYLTTPPRRAALALLRCIVLGTGILANANSRLACGCSFGAGALAPNSTSESSNSISWEADESSSSLLEFDLGRGISQSSTSKNDDHGRGSKIQDPWAAPVHGELLTASFYQQITAKRPFGSPVGAFAHPAHLLTPPKLPPVYARVYEYV
jgi:hypothetical protein